MRRTQYTARCIIRSTCSQVNVTIILTTSRSSSWCMFFRLFLFALDEMCLSSCVSFFTYVLLLQRKTATCVLLFTSCILVISNPCVLPFVFYWTSTCFACTWRWIFYSPFLGHCTLHLVYCICIITLSPPWKHFSWPPFSTALLLCLFPSRGLLFVYSSP